MFLNLQIIAQIFEKLVYKLLINYVEKYNILTDCQFGFRKGHSTEQAITEITENFRKSIDNNLYTCGIFLDFAKAFDTVNHSGAPRAPKARARGAPLIRKYGNPSIRENLVMTSPYARRTYVRTYVRTTVHPLDISQSQM